MSSVLVRGFRLFFLLTCMLHFLAFPLLNPSLCCIFGMFGMSRGYVFLAASLDHTIAHKWLLLTNPLDLNSGPKVWLALLLVCAVLVFILSCITVFNWSMLACSLQSGYALLLHLCLHV